MRTSVTLRFLGSLFLGLLLATGQAVGAEDQHPAMDKAEGSSFEAWKLEQLSEETFAEIDLNGDGLIQQASEWVGSPELFAGHDFHLKIPSGLRIEGN